MNWMLLLVLLQAPAVHEQCRQCHTEAASDVEGHKHFGKGVSCEACHGASEKHRAASGHAAPDRVAVREQVPSLCGGCHPAERKSYEASKHWTVLKAGEKSAHCATCHGNHAARSARAMENTCTRCHATLPAACSAAPKQAAKVRCAGCHTIHSFQKP